MDSDSHGHVSYEPDQEGDNWQKVDARVLGQILAAQNMVFALPDTTHVAEFYAQTLLLIPGIIACRVCVGNKSTQAGRMEISACAECNAVHNFDENDESLLPANSSFQCRLANQPAIRVIPIDSYQHHFGLLVFKIEDTVVFDHYYPFLYNLSNYVAIVLENRLQKDWLQKARDELERRVEERTHDLTVANEALALSRLAALHSMQEAIDAQKRVEKANTELQREIAERRHAEEEIQKLNQELEQRVLDRTAQLEAVNKELEAFAYSVSHDLRAPLRHIDGFIELLQRRTKTLFDDQSQHYMQMIAESVKKMGTLIDDLLSFSRMSRNEMITGKIDLYRLIQETIHELRFEMQDRSIEWHIATLPAVVGDPSMLKLVMTNLISNALKFTRLCKHPKIEIGSFQGIENDTIFFVRDNGVGFDMAYADKLFGVFQRLHHQEDFEGTGIGLADVRRIINRHGGRTWAEGKIDQGATIYFSLPTPRKDGM